jgi:hypothetical protein
MCMTQEAFINEISMIECNQYILRNKQAVGGCHIVQADFLLALDEIQPVDQVRRPGFQFFYLSSLSRSDLRLLI